MKKLVVLKLDGDLENGVQVTLEIGQEDERPFREIIGHLPKAPKLALAVHKWQSTYRSLGNSNRAVKAVKVTYVNSITNEVEKCNDAAHKLKKSLNNWLLADPFRTVRETWIKYLSPNDEAQVLIRTSCSQLHQIPWHLWDLIEDYPKAEIALSTSEYQQTARVKAPTYRDKVKILAILGNSVGIDIQKDQLFLKELLDAEPTFLIEPQRQDINEQLWNQNWNILFFAGHSQTENDSGRIYINQTDSLTIEELKYALRNAVSQGLQLAIFNSCDGLGLAYELEALHIPQTIVMREPVPDKVAQTFLKYFLTAFAFDSKPLYQAEKEARLKLHGLEDKYACASWLPVLFQNPATAQPTWDNLGRRFTNICPYCGLFAFREKDAQFFFGRESFTDILVEAVQHQSLVAVIGPSGSGKSSVVFAGLVKRLRDAGQWDIIDFRPSSRPLFSIASAIVSQTEPNRDRINRLDSIQNLVTHLQLFEDALRNVVDDIIRENPDKRLLLVADQFEELYTLCRDPQERKTFLDRLLEAIARCHNFTLVITLRADFLGQALSYRPLSDALQYADLKLGPMTDTELQDAVEKPAALLGVTIEEGLVERILSTVNTEPGNLPLLEFALTQLWAKQLDAKLTHTAYNEIGGVEAALACYAEEAYKQLNFEEKERAQRIFVQLVHPGEGTADTRRIATVSWDGTVKLWNSLGQFMTTLVENKDAIYSVSFSPDGKIIATADIVGNIQLWTPQRKQIATFKAHKGAVYCVKFSPNGKTIATASADGTAKLWNLDGKELQTLKGHKDWVWSVNFSPDGQTIATASSDRTVKLWSLEGKEIKSLNGHKDSVTSISFSPDGKTIATASADKTAILWSIDGEKLQTLTGHNNWIWRVSFSPDGHAIATASKDKTIKLWKILGKELMVLPAHNKAIYSVSFSPDSQEVATASGDGTVKFWARSGELLAVLKGYNSAVTAIALEAVPSGSIALHPTAQTMVTTTSDGTVTLWSRKGEKITTFKGHEDWIWSVNFSPNGQTFATTSKDKTVKLWNLNGKLLRIIKAHDDTVNSVSFSPDGKTLATASWDTTAKLWTTKGQLIRIFTGHLDGVHSISFSPDGKIIATASEDKTVKLWTTEGKLLKTLTGHNAGVFRVQFSPDGKTIATASLDHTVKLWNLDGKELKTYIGHDDSVWSLNFSPDGHTLASGDNAGRLILWNLGLESDGLLAHACDWARDYLENNPNLSKSDRHLCRRIGQKINRR
ncbi:CHAT domain-containing protein [Scytonema sp. UIC 10036]|uniref:nSTAND1 domain-containing NTPase n=1 Tax=Scytonema sp. UIC 10036 TaxID=2304196 RepID=UPI0012DAA89C|nr:CHAT domain-containing protein [Scytonema sp. UIC 10036]MUG91309.1 CHAT domain-containing protein [Scytonema sp. UIC 10036]